MADPSPSATPRQGQVIKKIGGFELIEKVGQGGMGAVFKARQVSLDRIVALKVLPPSIAKNKEFIERFIREARAAGRLNHPNIVQGIDVGLCEKTRLYYFAMEFVDGPPLGQTLKDSGAFPEEYVCKIARQMGEALDYANQNGIVHRDIKPDNILMNSQGMAKLADLGLAKQMEKREDASLTQAGVAMGTPFYMAPEQIRGQLNEIDTRTDLYCLGATLFHLVTGQPPYQGATGAVIMAAHLSEKVPLAHQLNANVTEGFSRLVATLMQKEKTRRPIDPKVFLEMLDRVDEVGGTTRRAVRGVRNTTGPREVVCGTTGPRERIRPTTGPRERVDGASPENSTASTEPQKSHTVLYFVVGLLLVMLIGGGVLALTFGGKKKEEPTKVAAIPEAPKPVKLPDPMPVSAPPAKPVWNASGEFENAQRVLAQNPDDLRGAVRLLERLFDEAEREKAEPVWIERITAARNEARSKHEAKVAALRADLDARIKDACAQGRYDAALQAVADFPDPDEDAERARLKELADGLCKDAEGKLRPLIQQARAALEEGRLDAVADKLKETESIAYSPLAVEIETLRNQLAEARKVEEQKAADAAQKAADAGWLKLLSEFDSAALEKDDTALLRVILKTARENKVLEPRKADVAFLEAVATKYVDLEARDRAALAAFVGQNVTWTINGKQVSGRIRAVKDETFDLVVTLERVEMIRKIKRGELNEEDQAKLNPPFIPKAPAEFLAAMLTKLKKGVEDRSVAAKFLEESGESVLAMHYRDLIRVQQADGAEADAEAAWVQIAGKAAVPTLTPRLTDELVKALDEFTKVHGQTTCAASHKQEIAALSARLNPKETDSVTADRLVLWNLTSTSSDGYYSLNRGTTKADVFLFLKDRLVLQIGIEKVNWKNTASLPTAIPLRGTKFDRLQVHVTSWAGIGGGFTEIQVFSGEENLALGRAAKASESDASGPPERVTDGEIPSGPGAKGWAPPGRSKGWIEIDFSKPAPKPNTPATAPAGSGVQGWKTPMGGTVRVEEGRISLAGPGTGDASEAVAIQERDPGSDFTIEGRFRHHGPFGGFILGYDSGTERFISFYSRNNEGVDMYSHV